MTEPIGKYINDFGLMTNRPTLPIIESKAGRKVAPCLSFHISFPMIMSVVLLSGD